MRLVPLAFALPIAVACGGTTAPGGDAAAGDASLTDDSGVDLSGNYACAAKTCSPGEYCVHPCCGGAPPSCDPLGPSGTCPYGSHMGTCNGQPGCVKDMCVPPPPYCAETDACIGGPLPAGGKRSRDAYCLCQ